MPKQIKILVTGAAGQIAYSLLFRIASGEMFGPDTTLDLRLLELPHSLDKLHAVRMELEDGAFPLLKNIVCTDDASIAMKDINWALLVGAVPRKAGMERSDLLTINAESFKKEGQQLNEYADKSARVLVVGNPCNTNALIAMENATTLPKENFYAMTMLDQNRAVYQLAHKTGMDVGAIKNMIIWGNHASTQYPDFYHATIAGNPTIEVIKDEKWLQDDFIKIVQQRGAEVIKARGSSSAASAANAIIQTVKNIVNDTPEGETFSLGVCSQGEYGVDEGLVFSFPCRVENGNLKVVQGIEHNAFAQQKIQMTLEELRHEHELIS